MGVFVFTLLHGSISIFHAVLPAFFKYYDFRITELVLLVYIVASIAVSVAVVSI